MVELPWGWEHGVQVQYALLRLSKTDDGGDCKRVKFVFITWVGEHAPAMKKGQVTGCKSSVGDLFKGYHIEKQLYERSELEGLEALLDADLKKAAGANYDMGTAQPHPHRHVPLTSDYV
jgi:hypothetical protein